MTSRFCGSSGQKKMFCAKRHILSLRICLLWADIERNCKKFFGIVWKNDYFTWKCMISIPASSHHYLPHKSTIINKQAPSKVIIKTNTRLLTFHRNMSLKDIDDRGWSGPLINCKSLSQLHPGNRTLITDFFSLHASVLFSTSLKLALITCISCMLQRTVGSYQSRILTIFCGGTVRMPNI